MEIKTVVEESEGAQENQMAPTDKVIDMAQQFGRMEATYRQTANELQELKLSQTQTQAAIQELMSELRQMQTQTSSIGMETAMLNESVKELAETEAAEEIPETLEITPPMETRMEMEIEQKPAAQRSLIQKLIYGSR